MKLATVLSASTLLAIAGMAACSSDTTTTVPGGTTNTSSSSSSSGTGTADPDQGIEGDGVGTASSAPDTNANGDKYPTKGIGTKKGAVIANFKFLGYPDGNVAGGLKPISLAEYFDPSGGEVKMLHIQAAGSWCSACRGETTALVPLAKDLKAKKVVWLVSLAEGPTPGDASTKTDLNQWIADFSSPFTHVLDPKNANLGPFYDRSALPWNANIDAKTMTVLTSGTGGAQTGEQIMQEIDDALALIK